MLARFLAALWKTPAHPSRKSLREVLNKVNPSVSKRLHSHPRRMICSPQWIFDSGSYCLPPACRLFSILFAIATAGTVRRFSCESSRWASRRSHSTAKPMTESVRRATNRLDSKGMSEQLHHPKRPRPQENLVYLFPLPPQSRTRLTVGKQCPFP
jgi:hypothetical protein